MKKSVPQGKKLTILELGAGRGGLSRFIAKEFQKEGLLEKIVSSNIAQKENDYNAAKSKEEGFGEDIYQVHKGSFDSLDFEPESFDLVFCNDSFLHSKDKTSLMVNIAKLIRKGGAFVFSDILENPEAPREAIQAIYTRLMLDSLGTKQLYEKVLEEQGLQKVESYLDTRNMERHYGMVKYSAQVLKKEELKKVVADEFVAKQVKGLGYWIESAKKQNIEWGWFAFKKN